MPPQHHHWIDGRPLEAASGDGFELRIEGTRTPIGRWPRAGARELALALEACDRGERAWSAIPLRERRRRLSTALEHFVNDRERDADTIAAFGCTPRELDYFMRRAASAVEQLFDGDAGLESAFDPRTGGANVVELDWTESFGTSARCAFAALQAGRSVVLVSDPRAPMIADGLGAALAEQACGAAAVLHDDGRTIMRAAFDHDAVARVHIASTSESALELAARAEPERSILIEHGFGAGIEIGRDRKLCVRRLANRSFVVRAEGELAEQAEAVVARAFGRIDALSGFASGRIGRVIVPARSFSRFTAEFLEALTNDPDAGDPLAIARSPGLSLVERAFALGHDEGATAIFTGFKGSGLSFPLVFTNVEERMKLARTSRPEPVLCLLRVADESSARSLATRIDV